MSVMCAAMARLGVVTSRKGIAVIGNEQLSDGIVLRSVEMAWLLMAPHGGGMATNGNELQWQGYALKGSAKATLGTDKPRSGRARR